ncbi:uncharacterized protein BKCO1_1500055 [Diplodia corticola]|uniref:Uncharacterized protein n=1 Tax=Diplodia corticola TaxID=236234 RepID=A0A1J9R356_9PEZI|nr:uncharacterized protein BKCO1_1500055 [Diplodia corticola]OJD35854.1 hypothetical protein BKCO1_1500055 [Diplodia corticola]
MPVPFSFPFQFSLFNRAAAQPQEEPAAPQTPPNPPSLTSSLSSASSVSGASSTPSTISDVQSQVRSLLQDGTSIYAASPALSDRSTPKPPSFVGFRRGLDTPETISPDGGFARGFTEPPAPLYHQYPTAGFARDFTDYETPLHHQYPTGPYRPAVLSSPQHDVPAPPPAVYTREPSFNDAVDPETAQLASLVNKRAKKRQQGAWVRRRGSRRTRGRRRSSRRGWGPSSPQARKKALLLFGSGLFLAMILTVYLSIALTRPHTGQEVHVLFILIILSTTILFCHSLVRLCMLSFGPQRGDDGPRIPEVTGPDGFQPDRPIRVHMARDEELGEEEEEDDDDDRTLHGAMDPEKEVLKAPPPAYGLWRCSVPINPDLLYWQRVDGGMHPLHQNPVSPNPPVDANAQPTELLDPFQTPHLGQQPPPPTQTRQGGLHPNREGGEQVPRPPSYVSDDGVRYVVEAAPRSVAPAVHEDTLSDVHPAYRGGLGIGR